MSRWIEICLSLLVLFKMSNVVSQWKVFGSKHNIKITGKNSTSSSFWRSASPDQFHFQESRGPNTNEPWGATRRSILQVLQTSQVTSKFRKETAARGGLVNTALCWATHRLPFPSCNSSTLGPWCPLRNDITSRTMCGNQRRKRCGTCLSCLKKIISEMRQTWFLGSFQTYCLPIDSSLKLSCKTSRQRKDGAASQVCSPTGQHGALPTLYRPAPDDSRHGNFTTPHGRFFYGLFKSHPLWKSSWWNNFFPFSSVHSLPWDNPLKTTSTIPLPLWGLYFQLSSSSYQAPAPHTCTHSLALWPTYTHVILLIFPHTSKPPAT